MDQIISNPGFQHIAEKIFITLNYEDILACRLINKSSNLILENPMLWIVQGILRGLSKENQDDWINVIKLTKGTKLESNITKYLRRVSKKSFFVDVPCFIDQNCLEHFLNTDFEIPIAIDYNSDEYGKIQLMSTFMKNPNTQLTNHGDGATPISTAAILGYVEIVKILAPLISDPINAHIWLGPFELAACGQTEAIQILSQLFANHQMVKIKANVKLLKASIKLATNYGFHDIVAILTPYLGQCQL